MQGTEKHIILLKKLVLKFSFISEFLKFSFIINHLTNFNIISGSTRPGAGTPQFQNLSGTIRTSANGLIPSTAASTGNSSSNSNNSTTQPQRTTLTSLYHNNSSSSNSSASVVNPSNTTNQQDMNQTPSPSDSAVGDLETMLKEKDTEINYLRETMEQNEQVIFKVSLVASQSCASKPQWQITP